MHLSSMRVTDVAGFNYPPETVKTQQSNARRTAVNWSYAKWQIARKPVLAAFNKCYTALDILFT